MALTDLLNKAIDIVEEKIDVSLDEFKKTDEQKEEDKVNLLKVFLPLAPAYVQDIVNNKHILIPKYLIEEKIQSEVKNVDVTSKGIALVVNNNTKFSNMDLNFTVVVKSINLKRCTFVFEIQNIELEKVQESSFTQAVGNFILKPIVELSIESIIKEKVQDLSFSDLSFKDKFLGEKMEMVCNFSNVKEADLIKTKLPILNKTFVDIVSVNRVTHQDDGINLGFDVEI